MVSRCFKHANTFNIHPCEIQHGKTHITTIFDLETDQGLFLGVSKIAGLEKHFGDYHSKITAFFFFFRDLPGGGVPQSMWFHMGLASGHLRLIPPTDPPEKWTNVHYWKVFFKKSSNPTSNFQIYLNFEVILLMEEPLHQLTVNIGLFTGFYIHLRRGRISFINSIHILLVILLHGCFGWRYYFFPTWKWMDPLILAGGFKHSLFSPLIWGNDPIWLIFFKEVETSN